MHKEMDKLALSVSRRGSRAHLRHFSQKCASEFLVSHWLSSVASSAQLLDLLYTRGSLAVDEHGLYLQMCGPSESYHGGQQHLPVLASGHRGRSSRPSAQIPGIQSARGACGHPHHMAFDHYLLHTSLHFQVLAITAITTTTINITITITIIPLLVEQPLPHTDATTNIASSPPTRPILPLSFIITSTGAKLLFVVLLVLALRMAGTAARCTHFLS